MIVGVDQLRARGRVVRGQLRSSPAQCCTPVRLVVALIIIVSIIITGFRLCSSVLMLSHDVRQ
jgi:hypothetical protein